MIFLDLLAFGVLGAFVFLGLLIPLTALWTEFLPHAVYLLDSEVIAAVKMTVLQAGVSAGISVLLGIVFAFILPKNSGTVRALLALPFGVPAVAASTAWVICMPKALSYSLVAVIVAHVF